MGPRVLTSTNNELAGRSCNMQSHSRGVVLSRRQGLWAGGKMQHGSAQLDRFVAFDKVTKALLRRALGTEPQQLLDRPGYVQYERCSSQLLGQTPLSLYIYIYRCLCACMYVCMYVCIYTHRYEQGPGYELLHLRPDLHLSPRIRRGGKVMPCLKSQDGGGHSSRSFGWRAEVGNSLAHACGESLGLGIAIIFLPLC